MKWITIFKIMFAYASCFGNSNQGTSLKIKNLKVMDTITLGAGCFWCVEAVFSELRGVESVVAGYAGGKVNDPTYIEVCSGTTGHAEVAQITYDSKQISLSELLEVFWKTHDPTSLNQQGADIGTQYRSVIFYHTETQKGIAETLKEELNKSGAWDKPIVTEISEIDNYYVAENYHQNYYSQNSGEQYCKYVIQPKLDKFREVFASKLKK